MNTPSHRNALASVSRILATVKLMPDSFNSKVLSIGFEDDEKAEKGCF